MIKAALSAASWLADKVKANPKLNPIPYPFFKSILNKQVEWARTQRGLRLEFEELAEAVRKELLKVGIHTMSESKKESKSERETSSLFEGTESEFVCRTCGAGNVDKKRCPLYNVFVCNRAGECMHIFMCAFYHDAPKCQMPAEITREAQL